MVCCPWFTLGNLPLRSSFFFVHLLSSFTPKVYMTFGAQTAKSETVWTGWSYLCHYFISLPHRCAPWGSAAVRWCGSALCCEMCCLSLFVYFFFLIQRSSAPPHHLTVTLCLLQTVALSSPDRCTVV